MFASKKIIKFAAIKSLWTFDIAIAKRNKLCSLLQSQVKSNNMRTDDDPRSISPSMANKGHFVVYSTDGSRFMIPLIYLKNDIFRDLLRMSEEEFGWSCDGPIKFPCDASFMKDVISVVERGREEERRRGCRMLLN
ncbi:hypothetical protein ACFE04_010873 [Oxalis oulophora]